MRGIARLRVAPLPPAGWLGAALLLASCALLGGADVSVPRASTPGVVVTVAGNGDPSGVNTFTRDGRAATDTGFSSGSFALGPDGVLYIADVYHHRVRRVGADGRVTTVAGNGTPGLDDGSPTGSTVTLPGSLDVDDEGNLYIDNETLDIPGLWDDHRSVVRKLTPAGDISTVFGGGSVDDLEAEASPTDYELFPLSDIVIDDAGNLWAAEANDVLRLGRDGSLDMVAGRLRQRVRGDVDGLDADDVTLDPGRLLVTDAGELYVSDGHRHIVIRVDAAGKLHRVAGKPSRFGGYDGDGGPARNATLDNPSGLAFDHEGNLYIADTGNDVIRKVTPDGTITTVAGTEQGYAGDGGQALDARFDAPADLEVDTFGDLYVGDFGNLVVRRITSIADAPTRPRGGG